MQQSPPCNNKLTSVRKISTVLLLSGATVFLLLLMRWPCNLEGCCSCFQPMPPLGCSCFEPGVTSHDYTYCAREFESLSAQTSVTDDFCIFFFPNYLAVVLCCHTIRWRNVFLEECIIPCYRTACESSYQRSCCSIHSVFLYPPWWMPALYCAPGYRVVTWQSNRNVWLVELKYATLKSKPNFNIMVLFTHCGWLDRDRPLTAL